MDTERGLPSQLPDLETRRAYDADVVDRYVASLQEQVADLQDRLDEALLAARDAEQRSAVMENAEILLGRSLLRAQRMAEEITEDAHSRARLIIAEARQEASDTLANVRRERALHPRPGPREGGDGVRFAEATGTTVPRVGRIRGSLDGHRSTRP